MIISNKVLNKVLNKALNKALNKKLLIAVGLLTSSIASGQTCYT